MIRYETLMLIRSEATNDELSRLEDSVEKLVADSEGKINLFDPWGKCRLAYPVEKNDYGIYILTRYEIPKPNLDSFFKELQHLFKIKLNEVVMRNVSVLLDQDAPIDYARPDSIEGSRSGNLDAFLKENKMEGFLSEAKTSDTGKPVKEVVIEDTVVSVKPEVDQDTDDVSLVGDVEGGNLPTQTTQDKELDTAEVNAQEDKTAQS